MGFSLEVGKHRIMVDVDGPEPVRTEIEQNVAELLNDEYVEPDTGK